jgi:anti-sigma B factor antagonist
MTVAFEVSQLRVGSVAVLAVTGDVDMLTAVHLTAAIETALATAPTAVIVDLSKVEFLASAGMSALVAAHADAAPTRLVVVADGPATSRPMKVVGLDNLLEIFATVDEALSEIGDA